MRALLLLSVLALASAPAQAQLSATANTVWANFGEDYYLALEQVGSGASGNVGVSDETPQEQLLALDPPLSQPAALDVSRTVDILACFDTNAAISGTVPVLLGGTITVSTEVRQGGTVIAAGEPQDVVLVPSTVGKATWNVTPTVAAIDPAAGNLEWYLVETGAAIGALFIPDCGDGDWSHVTLPVAGSSGGGNATAPVVRWSNVTGDIASLERGFGPADANATAIYNWTTSADKVRVRYAANVTAGSLGVTVRDGSGAVVFNVTVDAAGQGGRDLLDVEPGAWNVTLEASGFNGTFSMTLQPEAEAEPTSTTTSTTTNNDNRTGTFPLREEEKTPGLGVPLLLAATAAAAVLVRRRTR